MKYFVELIKQSESNCSRALEVKVKRKNITILAGKIMHENCKSNVELVKKKEQWFLTANVLNYLKASSAQTVRLC